jgi:platelet-activating factor acetylhydrolase
MISQISWSPGKTPDVMRLRSMQLDIRVSEVYEAYASFSTLIKSGPQDLPSFHLYTDDGPPPVPAQKSKSDVDPKMAWLDSWRNKVDVDDLTLVGHSFGGGTLLHLLSTGPPEGFGRLPVRKAVALDPW